MSSSRRSLLGCLFLASMSSLIGCGQQPAQEQFAEALVVPVSKPLQRKVTEYVDYTGRTTAVNSVDIRPRVTGYLMKMPFKEGNEVRVGDPLFEIDKRPYQALVDQAQAQVNLNLARLQLAKGEQHASQDRRTARAWLVFATGIGHLPGARTGGGCLGQGCSGDLCGLQT